MRTRFLVLMLALAVAAGPAAAKTVSATAPDGVSIHAESAGSGPAVVLVHGWSCDASYWDAQVADLASDHQVVAIDLAGHGRSGAGRADYTMAAFGADVAAVLAALDLHDAVLVGHSMGGAVIVEAALAAPDRVRGLIGVDNFQNVKMVLADQQIAGFVSTFESNFSAFVPQWVGRMFPADADSALRADVASDMAAAPQDVAISAMANLLRWYGGQAPARLRELKVPLMNINSRLEPTHEDSMREFVPGYQARYLDGVGHFLFREKPAAFNALLRETLAAFD
ncbi:alpha/beta hydrolase [bacterium]|nr:alpha/beta hydrolase [bacterium]